ncbi:MAG: FmdB family zinc ribbon protein [Chthoniobacterales bacterium]
MPTYEYECPKCKKTFDVFQSMKDEPLKTCPDKKCKGKVKRLIGTGAGLIFKGSGFYITDYRSEGYKQSAKKDAPPAETKSSNSSKSDSTKSGNSSSTPAAKPKADKSKS